MTTFRGFPPDLFAFFDGTTGARFEGILAALAARSLPVTSGAEPPLRTGPPGYPSTHPRIELLRWKGAIVVQEHDKADWMHTAEALERIREAWRGAHPLRDWLDGNVGATAQPTRSPRVRSS